MKANTRRALENARALLVYYGLPFEVQFGNRYRKALHDIEKALQEEKACVNLKSKPIS